MKKYLCSFNTSDYPKDHELYNDKNINVIGKFKNECNGAKMLEFISLISKTYVYETNKREVKKLKGIKMYVLNKDFKLEDCKK
jgi:hypothetical protein